MNMSVSSMPIGSVAISRRADAAPDVLHFVGKLREDRLFHLRVVFDRFVQIGARQPDDADGDRSFGEPRHELRPQVRGDHSEGDEHDAGREADHQRLVVHREPQDRRVDRDDAIRISSGSRSSICRGKIRLASTGISVSDRIIEPDQREDDRERHRPEQLAFDALQREDRQVDDHDDEFAEHRRLADLDGRVADHVSADPQGAHAAETVARDVPVLAIPRGGAQEPGLTEGALMVVGLPETSVPVVAQAAVTTFLSVVLTR